MMKTGQGLSAGCTKEGDRKAVHFAHGKQQGLHACLAPELTLGAKQPTLTAPGIRPICRTTAQRAAGGVYTAQWGASHTWQ
jgi:hypothetical protein